MTHFCGSEKIFEMRNEVRYENYDPYDANAVDFEYSPQFQQAQARMSEQERIRVHTVLAIWLRAVRLNGEISSDLHDCLEVPADPAKRRALFSVARKNLTVYQFREEGVQLPGAFISCIVLKRPVIKSILDGRIFRREYLKVLIYETID